MKTRFLNIVLILFSVMTISVFAVVIDAEIAFTTTHLTDTFHCEGAHFGDFNRDGHGDVVSGPYIYLGPDWQQKIAIEKAVTYDPLNYSVTFETFTYDLNADGWLDVVHIGFPGKETSWYANPGKAGWEAEDGTGHWPKHIMLAVTDNESPGFVDITGDGKPELVCMSGGFIGYATADWDNPTQQWAFHPCSEKGPFQRFTHGIGAGDINGDGKADLLELRGWWQQPQSLAGDSIWLFHPVDFGRGGAQMLVYDVDADGDNDVLTSIAAHEYGLAWFENAKAEGNDGEIPFTRHDILPASPMAATVVQFSQPHALDLADMNGDGKMDIVTGKRWWAHGPKGDPEPNAAAVLYWFELQRTAATDGEAVKVQFIPHLVHDNSGVGTQVIAGDLNGDQKPDIIVGNKKGTFVHVQQ